MRVDVVEDQGRRHENSAFLWDKDIVCAEVQCRALVNKVPSASSKPAEGAAVRAGEQHRLPWGVEQPTQR